MPAVSISSSPVIAAPNPPSGAGGPAPASTDAESANAFASVLSGQMNGAPGAAPSGSEAGRSSDKPVSAESSAESAADGFASLLPILFGTASGTDGKAVRADEGAIAADGGDGVAAQAELALALLAAPAGTEAGQPAPERLSVPDRPPVAAPAFAGNGAVGSGDAASPAAILAAAAETKAPRHGTDAFTTLESPKPGSPVAAAPDGFEKLRAEGAMRDAGPDVGELAPDRPTAQQALAHVQAAASRHAAEGTYHVAPAVGTRQWESAIGNSLVFMTGQQQNRAEIVLTPPQLGRIEISLTVNASNEATATFVSASPAVQEALTNAVPRLKEILADAGITLSQADVNAGSPEQSPGGNGDSPRRPATADFGDDGGARTVAAGHWPGAGRGLVDVFA